MVYYHTSFLFSYLVFQCLLLTVLNTLIYSPQMLFSVLIRHMYRLYAISDCYDIIFLALFSIHAYVTWRLPSSYNKVVGLAA